MDQEGGSPILVWISEISKSILGSQKWYTIDALGVIFAICSNFDSFNNSEIISKYLLNISKYLENFSKYL